MYFSNFAKISVPVFLPLVQPSVSNFFARLTSRAHVSVHHLYVRLWLIVVCTCIVDLYIRHSVGCHLSCEFVETLVFFVSKRNQPRTTVLQSPRPSFSETSQAESSTKTLVLLCIHASSTTRVRTLRSKTRSPSIVLRALFGRAFLAFSA